MKRKLTILVILFSISGVLAFCQVTEGEKKLRTQSTDTTQGWKRGGVLAVNLAQTSLTNWAAGGQNSLAINGLFSVFANLKQGKSAWDNLLDLGYGMLRQGGKGADFTKTDDKIDLTSKYGREAFKNVYYAALLNFRTQMTPGYKYPDTENKISDLFAPAYLLTALGMDYKPNPYFSAFLAPLTAKFTFVTDNVLSEAGAFGVTPGKKARAEIGGYLRVALTKNDFKNEFMKNISFATKVDLFSNYLDKPQNIDVNWETLISMKVNKFISANLSTNLLYDDNILIPIDRNHDGDVTDPLDIPGKRIQFKEIFGVGFSFNF